MKRLLGLAHFCVGSANRVELQIWVTWPLCAVLVALTHAVAYALNQLFAALSLAKVYRRLHFFTGAYQQGEASDPIAYLAAKAGHFGVIERQRSTSSSRFKALALTADSAF